MKIINILITIVIFMSMLTGCSSISSKPLQYAQITETTSYSYCKIGLNGATASNCKSNGLPYYDDAYVAAGTGNNCADQKIVRNKILSEQMRLIDNEYDIMESGIKSNLEAKNFAANIVSIALTSVATVVGGAGTKTILAAVDTGLKGVNASYDKEFLQNKAIDVLISQMRTDRAKTSTSMKTKMNDGCSYSLQEGIANLGLYRKAGTVNDALINLANDTGKKTAEMEKIDLAFKIQ